MRLQSLATIILVLTFSPLAMAASMSGMAHMNEMESHLKQMEVEMQAINQIKDPQERRARIAQHLSHMTQMMHDMDKARPTMTAEEQGLHMQMLEKRVDLLQMMMSQVVSVQAASYGFKGPLPTD